MDSKLAKAFMRLKQEQATLSLIAMMIGALVWPPIIDGHDLAGMLYELNAPEVPDSIKNFNRAYLMEHDIDTRSVLQGALKWEMSRITVCFMGGPAPLRGQIASAMNAWTQLTQGRLRFDFGDQADVYNECDERIRYNIRIGFNPKQGNRSYVGTESMDDRVFPKASMNLNFDTTPPPNENTVRRVTLHETGHALGFHHEHQSPVSPCTGWNWEKILQDYQWAGNTIPQKRKDMEDNLQKLTDTVLSKDQHMYTYTTYDKASIMHYSFPAQMFEKGESDPCYKKDPSSELSAIDKEAMKNTYSKSNMSENRYRAIDKLLNNPRYEEYRDFLNTQKQLYPDK